MNPYSTDKALLHADRLRELKDGRQPNPVHLQLILSDLCNHDCAWCAYRMSGYTSNQLFGITDPDGTYHHNPNRMIPTGKVMEILADFAGMGGKAVQFTGGGEPTVHPDCAPIIHAANAMGLDTSIVTNGQNLNRSVRAALVNSTWVRVSIDAGTVETYAPMRRVKASVWKTVHENVRALVDLRNRTGSKLYIGVSFIVSKENWREILLGAEVAKSLGVDSIRYAAVFNPEGIRYYDGFLDEARSLCKEATKGSTETFKVIDNFGVRSADLDLGNPDYDMCAYQHLTTYIGADLNLYRCCVLAYNERGLVGSLKDQRLPALWRSVHKQADFAALDPKKCERCQFNDRNRQIQKIIEQLPGEHGNFV